jgi:hypothetical protein
LATNPSCPSKCAAEDALETVECIVSERRAGRRRRYWRAVSGGGVEGKAAAVRCVADEMCRGLDRDTADQRQDIVDRLNPVMAALLGML